MRSGIIHISALFIILHYASVTVLAQDAYLLYTANVNGAIENCNCGSNPLGGTDRLKSFVDKFKREHPGTILIDGGDFFNSYPYPELNSAMLRVLSLMEYDIIIPGEQVFTEDDSLISRYLAQTSKQLLISNAGLNYESFREFKTGGGNILIYSLLNPDVFNLTKAPELLKLSGVQFPTGLSGSQNSFHVLVYHGKIADLRQILQVYPWIDLVLLGHDQQNSQLVVAGKTVVGVGRDAESVAVIHITRKSGGISAEIAYQKIDLSLPADQQIGTVIKEYKMAIQPREKHD